MKEMLSYVDLVIECRDFRVPHTSVNPLFEELVQGKKRFIVFTKRDMGGDLKLANQQVCSSPASRVLIALFFSLS